MENEREVSYTQYLYNNDMNVTLFEDGEAKEKTLGVLYGLMMLN